MGHCVCLRIGKIIFYIGTLSFWRVCRSVTETGAGRPRTLEAGYMPDAERSTRSSAVMGGTFVELERRLASASNVPFSASEVRAVEHREGSNGLSGLGAYEGIEK